MVLTTTNGANGFGAARAARLLFRLTALGEIGAGALALVFPQILGVLMVASLDVYGLLLARMLGSAVLALGVTWWLARNEPLRPVWSRHAAGFIIYNLGMGVLFVFRALAASEPGLPWMVAIVHVLAGVAFAGTVWAVPRTEAAE